jgi:hypothetical protein
MSYAWQAWLATPDGNILQGHTIPPEVQQNASQVASVSVTSVSHLNTSSGCELKFTDQKVPAIHVVSIDGKLAYYLITANNASLLAQEPGFPIKFTCSGNSCTYTCPSSTAQTGLSPGAIVGIILVVIVIIVCAVAFLHKK